MRKCLFAAATAMLALCAAAGAGGVVVKGVLKTWDEIAAVALKASGRATSQEAVAAASKTLKATAEEYGDDVAVAAMKGGVEIAEQTAKNGGRFLAVVRRAGDATPGALRALALNPAEAMQYAAKYGDDVLKLNNKSPGVFARGVAAVEKSGTADPASAIKAVADLPAEDIPRVIGAIEKNPQVAKEFLSGVERGGKKFVDRIFELSDRQIRAGGLAAAEITVAAGIAVGGIVAASNLTAPSAAEGRAIDRQTDLAGNIIENAPQSVQMEFAKDGWDTTNSNRRMQTWGFVGVALVLAVFAGVALIVYARKKR